MKADQHVQDVGGTRFVRLTANLGGSPDAEIEIGSDRWRELVDDCRKKDADFNWRLGDAALELAPAEDNGGDRKSDQFTVGALTKLREFAEQVECSFSTLQQHRRTSNYWPVEYRQPTVSHRAHRELNSRDDRFTLIRPGMTLNEAIAASGKESESRRPFANEPTLENITSEIVAAKERIRNAMRLATRAELDDDTTAELVERLGEVRHMAEQFSDYLTGQNLEDELAAILGEGTR